MRRFLLVFGTRPEAIKMLPLISEFKKFPERFDVKICITGQHTTMLEQILTPFGIMPDYNLSVMTTSQDLYDITTKILTKMRDVLKELKPEIVFVHGDTTTSFAAALASFYQNIPIAHIEAGLRTYNLSSPYPEEMNRQLCDRISSYCFAPTEVAVQNLKTEKINSKIFNVGNTIIDALLMAVAKIGTEPKLRDSINADIAKKGYCLDKNKKIILVTGHRRENFGNGFANICKALKEIAAEYLEADIVYPVHLNPNVRNLVFEQLSAIKNIYLIEPLEYLSFVHLMQNSYLILTDSGGIQEEAPTLKKPVLVMRNTTERPEAVNIGAAKLVGTDTNTIKNAVAVLLKNENEYKKMVTQNNPYGDGKAAKKIVDVFLEDYFDTRT